jgi:hypothetical protein
MVVGADVEWSLVVVVVAVGTTPTCRCHTVGRDENEWHVFRHKMAKSAALIIIIIIIVVVVVSRVETSRQAGGDLQKEWSVYRCRLSQQLTVRLCCC